MKNSYNVKSEAIQKYQYCQLCVLRGKINLQESGDYRWMDGWHVVYTNWGDGEPSDPEGTGGCVSMHADGKWYDDPCDNAYFTPCKQTEGKNFASSKFVLIDFIYNHIIERNFSEITLLNVS